IPQGVSLHVPLPLQGERSTSRGASSRTAPLRPVFIPSIAYLIGRCIAVCKTAASPCASTSRIGGKDGIGGEQSRLVLQTASRTEAIGSLNSPRPSSFAGQEDRKVLSKKNPHA